MKQFVDFENQRSAELLSWFSNQAELTQWAGPGLDFTQEPIQLLEQLSQSPNTSLIHSFSLLEDDEPIAFGQYYLRHECAHLCRLVVSPASRGHGIARELIVNLLQAAKSRLSVSKASLFVYPDNISAITAYRKLGFRVVSCLGDDPIDDCLYMQRLIKAID